jgi:hypothetical protein
MFGRTTERCGKLPLMDSKRHQCGDEPTEQGGELPIRNQEHDPPTGDHTSESCRQQIAEIGPVGVPTESAAAVAVPQTQGDERSSITRGSVVDTHRNIAATGVVTADAKKCGQADIFCACNPQATAILLVG